MSLQSKASEVRFERHKAAHAVVDKLIDQEVAREPLSLTPEEIKALAFSWQDQCGEESRLCLAVARLQDQVISLMEQLELQKEKTSWRVSDRR